MNASATHPDHDFYSASTAENGETRLWGIRAACFVAVGLATFFNTIDINASFDAGEDHLAIDWPVIAKLIIAAICGSIGVFGVTFFRQVRQSLMSVPGMLLLALSFVLLATSAVAYEEVANVSRIAAVINFGYLLFVPTVLFSLGLRRFMLACLVGLVANLIINWGLYLIVPDVGIFEEDLGNHVLIERMGGLGHPNAIARTGVMAALLCLAFWRTSNFRSPSETDSRLFMRMVLVAIISMSLFTMLAAFSRSAFVAGVVASGFLMLDRLLTRTGILFCLLGVMAILAGVVTAELATGKVFQGDSVVSAATKSGDIEELTSATGRTLIWAEAIRLIGQRPLTGWGLNSAPKLMQDFSMHTHNLILHATFSGGIFAGLLVIALLARSLFWGIASFEPLVRAISAYVLVSGLFEDTVLDTFASPSSLLWFAVLLYPARLAAKTYVPSKELM